MSRAAAPALRGGRGGIVRLSVAAAAVHVRTARLVAVTVARGAGCPVEVVESVRHAVGEACTIALADGRAERLNLVLDDTPGALVVWVGPVLVDLAAAADLPRAVLSGLTDSSETLPFEGCPYLRLSWAHSSPCR